LKTIITIFLALAFWVAQSASAAGNCKLDDLTDKAADHPLCLFYTGTAAYRAGDFAQAATSWKALIALKSVPVELEHLQLSVYNNLGFLYFFGKGVKTNKVAAIDYWKYATKSGHEEAAYHLCHAYADREQATFSPKEARGYCKEALRRYGLLKDRGDGYDTIVSQINMYLRKVGTE
jgi:TPR repeat protein